MSFTFQWIVPRSGLHFGLRRLRLSKIPNLLFVLIQLAERKEVPLVRERKVPKPDHDKSKEYRDQNDSQICRVIIMVIIIISRLSPFHWEEARSLR